jgi:hypothetical protein
MSLPAATIGGGASPVHERNEADFYPTPPECTVALCKRFEGLFPRVVWEPACGDGAISRVLEAWGFSVASSDLHDRGYGQDDIDFLAAPVVIFSVITNPPFALAEQFIRKAREAGKPFAMLLKATYWHAASRHALFKETGPAYVCPLLWRPAMAPERGKSPTLDFCWTVWSSGPAVICQYEPLPRPTAQDMSILTTDKGDIFA